MTGGAFLGGCLRFREHGMGIKGMYDLCCLYDEFCVDTSWQKASQSFMRETVGRCLMCDMGK